MDLPNAYEVAVAAECVRKQNKFKAYHNYLLFVKIKSFSFDSLALKAVVNIVAFNKGIKMQATAHIVQSSYDLSQELQLKSVPTFIINLALVSMILFKQQLVGLVEALAVEE